jgi:hypothetical protein
MLHRRSYVQQVRADKLAPKKLRARKVATSEVVYSIIIHFIRIPSNSPHRGIHNTERCGVELAAHAPLHLNEKGGSAARGARSSVPLAPVCATNQLRDECNPGMTRPEELSTQDRSQAVERGCDGGMVEVWPTPPDSESFAAICTVPTVCLSVMLDHQSELQLREDAHCRNRQMRVQGS